MEKRVLFLKNAIKLIESNIIKYQKENHSHQTQYLQNPINPSDIHTNLIKHIFRTVSKNCIHSLNLLNFPSVREQINVIDGI
jgi:hypothetical protein